MDEVNDSGVEKNRVKGIYEVKLSIFSMWLNMVVKEKKNMTMIRSFLFEWMNKVRIIMSDLKM